MIFLQLSITELLNLIINIDIIIFSYNSLFLARSLTHQDEIPLTCSNDLNSFCFTRLLYCIILYGIIYLIIYYFVSGS